jgi:ElaB/YqjD/DUF883 family membrane-anchored ribosome-binding protein
MEGAQAMNANREQASWEQEPASEDAEPGVARVVEQSRRVRADVEGLVSAVFEARSEWESELRERLTQRPYVGLATAAGLGYVLGAGLSPGLIRVAFGVGRRVAFAVMMRRIAAPLTEMVVGRTP